MKNLLLSTAIICVVLVVACGAPVPAPAPTPTPAPTGPSHSAGGITEKLTLDELSAMADLLDEINNAGTDVPLPPPYDELAKSASPPTGGKLKEH